MELIVLLDAGHGPGTPGKRSPDGTLLEFEFNRPTAERTRAKLLKYKNVTVWYIHANDRDKPLQERTDLANRIQAANPTAKVIYISIHANAYGTTWNDVKGIETYIYSTRPAGALKLANNVQNYLLKHTGRPNRGVKAADFHVLRETKHDAILVEAEFMTNKEALTLLKSDSYRDSIAQGIADGIQATFNLELIPTPPPAPVKPAEATEEPTEAPVSPRHAEAWEWAIEAGITAGGNPAGPTTRQQTIQLIYNAILWQQNGGKIL